MQPRRPESPISDALLAEIRERFLHVERDPISGPRIFLENGGGSLILKDVVARSAEIQGLPDSPSRRNAAAEHLRGIVQQGTQHLHVFFGAEGGQILYGATGTDILFRLVRAVLQQAGPGSVLSSSLEHAASHDAAYRWADAFDKEFIDIAMHPDSGLVTPADYAAAIRPDTLLATVIHTSHVSGKRVDLPGICAAIRATAPDCFIVCDGIQHAPHGPIHAESDGVDAYVYAPYKAFSRRGGAFAWISERLATIPHHDHLPGKPPNSWELGSKDASLFAGASAVHDYLTWLGGHFTDSGSDRDRLVAAMDAANAHEVALIDLLINGRDNLPGLASFESVTLVGDADTDAREGAVCFAIAGRSSTDVVDAFDKRGIRLHHRQNEPASSSRFVLDAAGLPDCVRVSMCHFNSRAEIEAVLQALPDVVG